MDFSSSAKKSWDRRLFVEQADGYLCPSDEAQEKFWASEAWYRQEIPLAFDHFEFQGRIRGSGSRTLVMSLGKDPYRVFQLQVGEKNPQLVGFDQVFVSSNGAEYGRIISEPYRLKKPINYRFPVSITGRSHHISDNTMQFEFDLTYFPPEGGDSITETVAYSVQLPVPNPTSVGGEYSRTVIGFGVYGETCILPITFSVCW